MKAIIKRVSCTEFYDNSGKIIPEMCYYTVRYASGAKKSYYFCKLPATISDYIKQSIIVGKSKGICCSFGATHFITTTYGKE